MGGQRKAYTVHWEDRHIGRIADSHGFSHHQEEVGLGIWGIPRTYILDCACRSLSFCYISRREE